MHANGWRRLAWSMLCISLPTVIAACAAAPLVSDAIMNAPFALAPEARASAVALSGVPPEPGMALRAYTLRVDTIRSADREVAPSFDVLGRQMRGPDGVWTVVSRTHGQRAWGMTRALSLCGLVSLQVETVLTDRAHRLADPDLDSRRGNRFTPDRALAPDTRMRVAMLEAQGKPCDPSPRDHFSITLRTQSLVRGGLPGPDGPASSAQIRYDCIADVASSQASRLHPDLQGQMLRVDCDRQALPDGSTGRVSFLWLHSSRVYLLAEHEGDSLIQRYVYTALEFGS